MPQEVTIAGQVTLQVTPLLLGSLLTVAVTILVCPWSMAWDALGERLTAIASGGGGAELPLLQPLDNTRPMRVRESSREFLKLTPLGWKPDTLEYRNSFGLTEGTRVYQVQALVPKRLRADFRIQPDVKFESPPGIKSLSDSGLAWFLRIVFEG